MKIHKRLLVAIILMAGFSGCATTGTVQVLKPEYQSQEKDFNASLTIFPLTEAFVSEESWASYIEKYPGDQSIVSYTNKEIFENYFALTFSETITGETRDLMAEEQIVLPEGSRLEPFSFPVSENKKISLMAPEKGRLISNGEMTDFALLTQSLRWEIARVEEQGKPVGGQNIVSTELVIAFKYLIWDNRLERVAGYGKIKESRKLTGAPRRLTYIQIFEELCRDIVRSSPFKERYVQ